MPSIETTALTKRYGSTTAVDQLNLSVPDGTVYGFLGPNGAGKTTTMRILTGLTTPTSGSATVAGVPVTDRDSLRPHIGYLPEEPPLYEQATAYEQLEYVAGLRDLPSRETQDRIDDLLNRLDLSPNDAATRIAEYSELVTDGRLAHFKGLDEVVDAHLLVPEKTKNAETSFIGEAFQ